MPVQLLHDRFHTQPTSEYALPLNPPSRTSGSQEKQNSFTVRKKELPRTIRLSSLFGTFKRRSKSVDLRDHHQPYQECTNPPLQAPIDPSVCVNGKKAHPQTILKSSNGTGSLYERYKQPRKTNQSVKTVQLRHPNQFPTCSGRDCATRTMNAPLRPSSYHPTSCDHVTHYNPHAYQQDPRAWFLPRRDVSETPYAVKIKSLSLARPPSHSDTGMQPCSHSQTCQNSSSIDSRVQPNRPQSSMDPLQLLRRMRRSAAARSRGSDSTRPVSNLLDGIGPHYLSAVTEPLGSDNLSQRTDRLPSTHSLFTALNGHVGDDNNVGPSTNRTIIRNGLGFQTGVAPFQLHSNASKGSKNDICQVTACHTGPKLCSGMGTTDTTPNEEVGVVWARKTSQPPTTTTTTTVTTTHCPRIGPCSTVSGRPPISGSLGSMSDPPASTAAVSAATVSVDGVALRSGSLMVAERRANGGGGGGGANAHDSSSSTVVLSGKPTLRTDVTSSDHSSVTFRVRSSRAALEPHVSTTLSATSDPLQRYSWSSWMNSTEFSTNAPQHPTKKPPSQNRPSSTLWLPTCRSTTGLPPPLCKHTAHIPRPRAPDQASLSSLSSVTSHSANPPGRPDEEAMERGRRSRPTAVAPIQRPPRPPVRTTSLARDSDSRDSSCSATSVRLAVSEQTQALDVPLAKEDSSLHDSVYSCSAPESTVATSDLVDRLTDADIERALCQPDSHMWWLRLLPYKPSNLPNSLAYRLRAPDSLTMSRSPSTQRLASQKPDSSIGTSFALMTQSMYESHTPGTQLDESIVFAEPAELDVPYTNANFVAKERATATRLAKSRLPARPSSLYSERLLSDPTTLLLPSLSHLRATSRSRFAGPGSKPSPPSTLSTTTNTPDQDTPTTTPIPQKENRVENQSPLPNGSESPVYTSPQNPLTKQGPDQKDSPLLGQYCRLLILRRRSQSGSNLEVPTTPVADCQSHTPSAETIV